MYLLRIDIHTPSALLNQTDRARLISMIDDLSSTGDNVNHPKHYTEHPSGVECIAVTEHMNFCIGNAIKYLWRADLKHTDSLQDLRKEQWYINREINRRL